MEMEETGVMEESTMMQNNEETSRNALRLQNKLDELRMEVVRAKARLAASQQPEDELEGDDTAKKLTALTKQRTDAFLGFRMVQLALQAGQANQALTRALNLEEGGDVALEKEEEEYVKSLLEEQRELTASLSKSYREEVEEELEIMGKEATLAELFCRYRELAGKAVGARRVTREAWDEQTKKAEKNLRESDQKINQMRFMIQKFMISHDKFGLQFDEARNSELQGLLVRCGQQPEVLRQQLEAAAATPAATGDFAME